MEAMKRTANNNSVCSEEAHSLRGARVIQALISEQHERAVRATQVLKRDSARDVISLELILG